MPPRTHDGKGPPPKRAKKTPVTPPTGYSPEMLAEMKEALEEKRSAEKAKKERAEKKANAKKREAAARTPPQPTMSADDAWKDIDSDSDGRGGGSGYRLRLAAVDENAANTDGPGYPGNLNFDGIFTRARRAASQSEASGETENDNEPDEVPSNQVAVRSKRSAEKEQTQIQKLAQAINASRSKITSKIKKYQDILDKNKTKNKDFSEAHTKFKKIGKDKKSPEILEFREVFLKMIGDNKDKFAAISWDTGETKEEIIPSNSPFHSGEKENTTTPPTYDRNGKPRMRYKKEKRQIKIFSSVSHELAQFLRITANYIDSKDMEAEKMKEEIEEERRIIAENREKREELEKAEWDAQMYGEEEF